MNNEPLTTGKIAKYCHVTYRSIINWINEGRLRAYKTPGGRIRVKVTDFLDFLNRYKIPVSDEIRGPGSKKRILLVDDDKNMASSLERMLRTTGRYETVIATDGFTAGVEFLKFRPDLVLLDIRMPGMDGYEVAGRIKGSPDGKDIKIIAMSAFFEEEGKERISSLGAVACFDKPFNNDELLRKIEQVLSTTLSAGEAGHDKNKI